MRFLLRAALRAALNKNLGNDYREDLALPPARPWRQRFPMFVYRQSMGTSEI
jgi:hypothetical protein